ncbi:MAG: hypothetical protein M9924_21540 [Rhizobiaceae bacterium]|nr:hypothetical protein [Rhizobiaceae bacterium]
MPLMNARRQLASPANRMSSEVRKAILRYLSERLENPLISTSDAIKVIKRQSPETSTVPAAKLADMVAEIAIEAGFDVAFDWEKSVH